MSIEDILETAKAYYTMGQRRKSLAYFPNFNASTSEREESAMIDKAIATVEMNNHEPANANVREICKKAQHVFFMAYREGLSKAPANQTLTVAVCGG